MVFFEVVSVDVYPHITGYALPVDVRPPPDIMLIALNDEKTPVLTIEKRGSTPQESSVMAKAKP